MNMRLGTKQLQKTILAPTMQQSIEVLLLPLAELNTAIEQELQENPLLEIDETKKAEEDDSVQKVLEMEEQRSLGANYEAGSAGDDEEMETRPICNAPSLEEHLLKQLHLEANDIISLEIGEYIIGNLDAHGFLTCSVEEIAEGLEIKQTAKVEEVLQMVQNFDPLGIAARNLRECLRIQSKVLYPEQCDALCTIIDQHMDELSRKNYTQIARKMKTTQDRIQSLAKLITQLEPRPARNFISDESNVYVKPDVSVTINDANELELIIHNESIPKLRVSQFYKRMLNDPGRTDEEKEFIHTKIKNALLFIRSIQQRGQTLRDIVQFIIDKQEDFFHLGHTALKPMSLKDVAEKIERNESTVSRAVSNKYIDTPQGLFPLKFFFSQAVPNNTNELSNRSLKEELKLLIDNEDKSSPLSDQQIQQHFADNGMNVARRTINKYRKLLNILPSHLRKE